MTLTISVMSEVNSTQATSKRILPKGPKLHRSISIIFAVKSVTRINHWPLMCAVLFAIKQGRRPRGPGGRSPKNFRWGDGPKKFEVGDGSCIRPPIFREVVLSDAPESTNRVKKCHKGILFWNSDCSCEERVIYDIEDSKRYGKSSRENGFFSRKNLIQKSWSAKKFSVPPKLGASWSPPLDRP